MSRPGSHIEAARQARDLLVKSMPGSRRGTVRAHLARAESIADAIWRRYQVGPHQWQAKHARWYLAHHCRDLAPTTRYDLWRTVRALAASLGRLDGWAHHLRGPWLRPTGDGSAIVPTGRPPKLPRGPNKSPSLSNTDTKAAPVQHGHAT